MATLYYGNGECTIEGTDIQGVEIRYKGAIEITKTCGDDCVFGARNNGIMIVAMSERYLTNLFNYVGNIKIISIIVADKNGKKVPSSIKKVMDYSELLHSNAEDLTVKSEDLVAGYIYGKTVRKTKVKDNIIKNQKSEGDLYLNGEPYHGAYHIHEDSRAMTGDDHTKDSKLLYIKKISSGRLEKT